LRLGSHRPRLATVAAAIARIDQAGCRAAPSLNEVAASPSNPINARARHAIDSAATSRYAQRVWSGNGRSHPTNAAITASPTSSMIAGELSPSAIRDPMPRAASASRRPASDTSGPANTTTPTIAGIAATSGNTQVQRLPRAAACNATAASNDCTSANAASIQR
jgi:hypothetical protein